eukprot:12233223-Alexandrium_andersonii.AAC.1
MSASLVGSEMCIRDRCPVWQPGHPARAWARRSHVRRSPGSPMPGARKRRVPNTASTGWPGARAAQA